MSNFEKQGRSQRNESGLAAAVCLLDMCLQSLEPVTLESMIKVSQLTRLRGGCCNFSVVLQNLTPTRRQYKQEVVVFTNQKVPASDLTCLKQSQCQASLIHTLFCSQPMKRSIKCVSCDCNELALLRLSPFVPIAMLHCTLMVNVLALFAILRVAAVQSISGCLSQECKKEIKPTNQNRLCHRVRRF